MSILDRRIGKLEDGLKGNVQSVLVHFADDESTEEALLRHKVSPEQFERDKSLFTVIRVQFVGAE